MSMRYSLKRLLLEQTDSEPLIKDQDPDTLNMLKISSMLAANGFSTKGRVGEDIVALLVGGLNTNKGADLTTFKDVKVGDVVIDVKGATVAGKRHSLIAKDNVKKLTADKVRAAASDSEKVALVIITASEDHKQLELTIFGPTDRDNAVDVLENLKGKPNSFAALKLIFGTRTTKLLPISSDKSVEAMKKIYDIHSVVLQMDDGEKIAEYLQGVADEIKRIWKD